MPLEIKISRRQRCEQRNFTLKETKNKKKNFNDYNIIHRNLYQKTNNIIIHQRVFLLKYNFINFKFRFDGHAEVDKIYYAIKLY